MFYTVTMVRDIRQAFFIDKKQIKRGEPDIVLVSPLGYHHRVSREALMNNFVTPDGKRIKLGHWRYGRKYIVVANSNHTMGAFRVPKRSKVKIVLPNGKEAKPGSYIICLMGNNGIVDKQRTFVIQANIFNRMFKIDKKPTFKADVIKQMTGKTKVVNNTNNKTSNTKKDVVNAKYMVVQRILSRNTGKIIGFVVSDGKVAKKLNTSQVMTMCRLKQLGNITIVDKDNKEFLRGVGIRIENLPAIVV